MNTHFTLKIAKNSTKLRKIRNPLPRKPVKMTRITSKKRQKKVPLLSTNRSGRSPRKMRRTSLKGCTLTASQSPMMLLRLKTFLQQSFPSWIGPKTRTQSRKS